MKKIMALLLIVSCLFAVMSFPVGATTSGNEVDFVVNANGEDITVDVKTNFACSSLQGALLYKGEEIAYNSLSVDSAIAAKNKVSDSIKNVTDATKFAFVGDVKDGTTGEWATISYHGEKPKFDLSSLKAYAVDGTKVAADAYIVFYGDANIDGALNLKDLVRLKKIAVGISEIEDIYKKNIDADKNGAWEPTVDMVAFAEYILSVLFN